MRRALRQQFHPTMLTEGAVCISQAAPLESVGPLRVFPGLLSWEVLGHCLYFPGCSLGDCWTIACISQYCLEKYWTTVRISQAALLLDWDMNHGVTQFLPFFFCVAGHFKDPGVWHKMNVWLDSTKMETGHLATLQLLCWLWPHTNRDAEVQSGSWQLSRVDMAPALGLKQPQVHCVYDCIAILCGLMPASDGNLAPADTLSPSYNHAGHHWARQSTLNSFHLFPSVNLKASLIIFIAFLWTLFNLLAYRFSSSEIPRSVLQRNYNLLRMM